MADWGFAEGAGAEDMADLEQAALKEPGSTGEFTPSEWDGAPECFWKPRGGSKKNKACSTANCPLRSARLQIAQVSRGNQNHCGKVPKRGLEPPWGIPPPGPQPGASANSAIPAARCDRGKPKGPPPTEAQIILDRFFGQSSGRVETACGRSRRVAAASATILAAMIRPKVASVQATSPSGIQR